VSAIERLVELLAAQYRWGLHPLKLLVALLAPVLIVWVADRRVRALAGTIVGWEEERIQRPPRTQRR
jgi:hypothetical protein